jgi:hypothetical protein
LPTITERVLASTGLASNLSSMQPREMGLTSDTERPAVGTTGGGSKYIGTEDFITVNTTAPAPLSMMKRSSVRVYVDTDTAAGHVSLDIRNGAELAGYECMVVVGGASDRYAIITYQTGLIEYVPAGSSLRFLWTGSAWATMKGEPGFAVGEYREMAPDVTPGRLCPVVKIWDSDKTLALANYPLLVPVLRAIATKAWGGAAYVASFTATIAGAGSFTATGAGTAWTNLLTAWAEEVLVNGGYTGLTPITVAGVEYAVTNINSGTGIVTATGSPPTGSQTVQVFRHRIVGSTTTAKTFQDSGRALMSPDGILLVPGFRRRDRFQGHKHILVYSIAAGSAGAGIYQRGAVADAPMLASAMDSQYTTDGTNGTPRPGPKTEPESTTVYRCIHAGVIL